MSDLEECRDRLKLAADKASTSTKLIRDLGIQTYEVRKLRITDQIKSKVTPKSRENFIRKWSHFKTSDELVNNVHLQHSMMLIKALTNAGVLFRTQIYPDEKHSLVNVKMHLYQTMEDFLEYTCFKSPERPPMDLHNGR
ncbi:dipeptidyl peptidase 4 [Caerostris darwini]|uniref:Dipeptidyl peptidase 4 n=1 Tax=Caerostris darwini TaxID=1538125 RepID=A0AAV4U0K3_9ARAC|nr:dipeptidyl peptidase 4 [Caerostris darwini]